MTDDEEMEIFFRENPGLEDFYALIREIFKETYEILYTKLIPIEDESKRRDIKKLLVKQGMPFEIITESGDLKGFFKPTKIITNAIINNIIFLRQIEKKEIAASGNNKHKDSENKTASREQNIQLIASVAAFYLHKILTNFEGEMSDAIESLSKLSQLDAANALKSQDMYGEAVKKVLSIFDRRKKEKRGIKRGGRRAAKGFRWTDKTELEFYRAVENLQKIKNKSAWEFAAEELIEAWFDSETIHWLKSRPQFTNVPAELFSEAIKKWRKYDEVSDIKDDEDKPRYFEFRHALCLLNYPDKFKFGTLRNHYFNGQRLSKSQ